MSISKNIRLFGKVIFSSKAFKPLKIGPSSLYGILEKKIRAELQITDKSSLKYTIVETDDNRIVILEHAKKND